VGDLVPLLTAVRRCMRDRAAFAFSTEATDGTCFEATLTGRFVHGWAYVRSAVLRCGFAEPRRDRTVSRSENGVPVPSDIVVCSLPT
jgi:predicted TPR repeat methyltransferase